MKSKSFIAAYKYQISRNKLAFLSVSAGLAMLLLMGIIGQLALTGKITTSELVVQLIDSLCVLTIFIYGIVFAGDFYNCSAANGISRKTTVIAQMLSTLSLSAVLAAITSVLSPLFSLITGNEEVLLAEILYGNRSYMRLSGESELVFRVRLFFLAAFIIALFGSLGFLLGTVIYRLPRKVSTVIIIVICVTSPIAPVIVAKILLKAGIDPKEFTNKIFSAVGNFFGTAHVNGTAAGNAVKGITAMTLCIVIMSLVSWLIARRASVRPMPIKNG